MRYINAFLYTCAVLVVLGFVGRYLVYIPQFLIGWVCCMVWIESLEGEL